MCYFSITSIQWHRTDEFKQKATNCCVRFGHSLRSAVRCQRQLVNDSNSLPRGRTTEWTEDAGNEVRCSTRDKLVFRASEKSLGNGNLISGVSRQSHCRRGEGRRGFLFSISKRSGEKGNNRCLNKISKRPRYQTDSLSDCFSLSLSSSRYRRIRRCQAWNRAETMSDSSPIVLRIWWNRSGRSLAGARVSRANVK